MQGLDMDSEPLTFSPLLNWLNSMVNSMSEMFLPSDYQWYEVTSAEHLPCLNDVLIWASFCIPLWIGLQSIADKVAYLPYFRKHSVVPLEKVADVVYSIMKKAALLTLTTLALYDKPWATDPVALWTGFDAGHKTGIAVRFVYFVQLGYYEYAFVNHSLSPHLRRRSDFTVMVSHHLITALLMMLSYSGNYLRIGVLIVYVHDIADLFLVTAKLGIYIESTLIKTMFSIGTLIAWPVTRLWYFPFKLIIPVYTIGLPMVDPSNHFYMTATSIFLWILCVMHVYWYYLIFTGVVGGLMKGTLHDTREAHPKFNKSSTEETSSEISSSKDSSSIKDSIKDINIIDSEAFDLSRSSSSEDSTLSPDSPSESNDDSTLMSLPDYLLEESKKNQ